ETLACIAKAPVADSSPVKKPSIAIVAGASTSEDVCPWEAGPPEPRSRKNSGQMDSGSSSSDISVAVAEVAEKVQRSCILTQQHTLDGGRKLSANPSDPPRRASVSVPIIHPVGDSSKRKVSSFEDNSSVATSTSSSVFAIPSDTNSRIEERNLAKTLKKSHSIAKTFSVGGTTAPIISVSSVADDLPGDAEQLEEEEDIVAEAESAEEEPEASGTMPEPLAPLAEPDSESPASEFPPSDPGGTPKGKETVRPKPTMCVLGKTSKGIHFPEVVWNCLFVFYGRLVGVAKRARGVAVTVEKESLGAYELRHLESLKEESYQQLRADWPVDVSLSLACGCLTKGRHIFARN
ncbi:hypothetical protein NQ318_011423, partial [Aromia moschata]